MCWKLDRCLSHISSHYNIHVVVARSPPVSSSHSDLGFRILREDSEFDEFPYSSRRCSLVVQRVGNQYRERIPVQVAFEKRAISDVGVLFTSGLAKPHIAVVLADPRVLVLVEEFEGNRINLTTYIERVAYTLPQE